MNRQEYIEANQKHNASKKTTMIISLTIEEHAAIKMVAERLGVSMTAYVKSRLFYEK